MTKKTPNIKLKADPHLIGISFEGQQLHDTECILDTVLPAKSDSDVMFCLQSYQGLRIDKSLVY